MHTKSFNVDKASLSTEVMARGKHDGATNTPLLSLPNRGAKGTRPVGKRTVCPYCAT